MIIGIDVDDVLAQLTDVLRLWHNARFGTNFARSDHADFNLCNVWGCSLEERTTRLEEFFRSKDFEDVVPLLGAADAVEQLSREHTLHVITSRHNGLKKAMHIFLDRYFPKRFSKIHLTGQVDHNAQTGTKAEVCQKNNVEILIEDGPEYATSCASIGVKVLLMDMPWNHVYELPPGVVRVSGWIEVMEQIRSLQ